MLRIQVEPAARVRKKIFFGVVVDQDEDFEPPQRLLRSPISVQQLVNIGDQGVVSGSPHQTGGALSPLRGCRLQWHDDLLAKPIPRWRLEKPYTRRVRDPQPVSRMELTALSPGFSPCSSIGSRLFSRDSIELHRTLCPVPSFPRSLGPLVPRSPFSFHSLAR